MRAPFRSTASASRDACPFLAAGFLLAALTTPLGAQADFRRGDANADGVVDGSDASFVSRLVFLADVFSSCMEAADANDDLTVDLSDEVRILQFLFEGRGSIPAPGPVTPGPDTTSGLGCAAYEPAAPPGHADLDLALECLGPDTSGHHFVAVTLTTRNNTAGEGAEAWSLSIGAEGYRILSVTHAGTADALTTDTPPGYRDPGGSFSWREVIDPDRVVAGVPQGPGAVAAVQLSTVGSAQIPADGTVMLLVLVIEKDSPEGPGPHRLFFEDGKQGSGNPVRNVITIHGASQAPSLGSFEECITDCNSNGTNDKTDIATGSSKDCDGNFNPDECDISAGTSQDCNSNDVPDSCDIETARSTDCDGNSVPDECDPDCNANGVADTCDISEGTSRDCNSNGIPDSCDGSEDPSDCNGNGEPDRCDIHSGTSQDCDSNGIPDSCDIAAGRLSDCDQDGVPDGCQPDCNSNDRADSCDIAAGESADADGDGVPDECDCNCACPSVAPIVCGVGAEPTPRLGFRGDCKIDDGDPATLRVAAFATLELLCVPPGGRGAQGWSFGIEVLDGAPISATTSGTAAAPTTEGGFRNPAGSFERTQVIDPARNFGRKGVVSVMALSTQGPGNFEIPPTASPHDILRLEVELSRSETCPRTTLRYVDGLAGAGQPLLVSVTIDGSSYAPITGAATWYRCSGGGFQFAGDGNQDGATNIADAIWLLGHLFLGSFPVLPCDGGTASAPAPGALALLDASGDGRIDLTDSIHLLNFLFGGGPPPPLGIGCVPIEGCPDRCAP